VSAVKVLSSTANPLIKTTLKLHDKKGRSASGTFLLEGRRELALALQHGIKILRIFYVPEMAENLPDTPAEKVAVTPPVLAKISYRGETEGFVAVAEIRQRSLADWTVPENPLLVVLDKLEKPGNIGAVLRTADAAGADAVLVCDELGDLYNPNLIRASLGAVFTRPVFSLSAGTALEWLKKNKIKITAASPYARQTHWQYDWSGRQALIIGSEADGLSAVWQENADASVLIPMSGEVDSLNASVSAAVLLYEAKRRRNNPPL